MRPLHWLFAIPLRLRSLFRWRQADQELDDELRDHIERKTEEYVAKGLAPEEARRAAKIELGGVEQVKEEVRAVRTGAWLDALLQDIRFGLRMLRKNPAFTTVAVLTLALGIGANTAIFSIVDSVLLRPLPFREPSRLVALHESLPKMGYPEMGFSPPDFAVFSRAQSLFDSLGAFRNESVDISDRSGPERVMAARVSASLFPTLGVEPTLGRNFAPEEDAPGHDVVILSYGFWQRRFGGVPTILGQSLDIDRDPYTVVGVMPQGFVFPLAGPTDNNSPAEVWVPMAFTPTELQGWGGSYFNSVIGRLRPGFSAAQFRATSDSLAREIVASYPVGIAASARRGQLGVNASTLQDEVVGSVRTLLLVLMAAVAFVLLIGCSNVAILLLSRAATRERETAIRTALGATRFRLMRQMLAESLLFALCGGALALVLAVYAKNFILVLVPATVPLPRTVPLNAGVLAFAFGSSVLTALLFGIVPAIRASAGDIQSSLQEGGRSGMVGRAQHRLQGFFVTAEFALAFVMLIGAGLLIRSFAKLVQTNPGFRPKNVLTLNVPLPRAAYSSATQIQTFYENLDQRVAILPGVETSGLSSDLPLNAREVVSISVEGKKNGEGGTPEAISQSWIIGNYLQTIGVPLLRGRWFTPEDRQGSEPVAIVSLGMAQNAWPGQDALGKRIRWGGGEPWETVVGIVGNVSQGPLSARVLPHEYRPYQQLAESVLQADPFGDWHAMNIAVRTRETPVALTSAVLAQIHSSDADLAVADIRTMPEVVSSSFAGPEFNMILLTAFAGLALLLAATGIYGVLAYAVTQRTHEIGVRMALGASPRNVLGTIVGRGLRLAGVAAPLGVGLSVFLTQLMKSLLYSVTALDPLTYFAVLVLLFVVAMLASYIPARRAMKVDPTVALRYE